jgi:hypothetical protein
MPILASRAGFMSGKFAAGKAPDAPTDVTSARLNLSLNISGTAPDFNGGLAITDYEYALSTNSGSTYGSWISSGSSSFPFQIPNLTNGQAYYVKIRGVNALGGGNEFGPITTGTTPSTVPNAPTNVSGTNYADSQSVVSWTAPADNGAAITGYKVEYAASPYSSWTTFNADTGTTATSITVTSLNNGTYYKFRISAINVAGTGPTGTSVSAFLPAVIPGVPTSPSISSGSGSITIQWGAPVSDGGAPPVTYTVETQKDSDAFVDRGIQTSPYAITGLPNDGSTYRARITASTVVGSSATKAATGDTVPSAVPAAPTFLSASSGDGTYYISWSAPANNGAAITSYTVQLTTANQTAWDAGKIVTGVTAGDYTFSGLNNGFSYRARVLAVNTRGSGPYVDPYPSGQETPSTTPGTPTFRGASAGDRSYTLQWNAPANGGAAIDYYQVQITNADQAVWSTIYSPNPTGTEVTFPGLLNGSSYRAQVRAHNVRGFGPWYDDGATTARTPDMIVPTISWESTSATKYSSFRASFTGLTGYSYQTQLYPNPSSWGDYGDAITGTGTQYTPYNNGSYVTTFYYRVKVSDPNGRVKYTNQIYVTNGRPGSTVIDRAANTVVDVAGYYTNSGVKTSIGSSILNNTANGAYGGTWGFESPYPIQLSSADYGFTGFRILMQKYDSGTYDLTSSTRRVYVYGPAGIGMALYSGATAGQTWGDGVASSTRWTGTGDVGYTWNVDDTTPGAVYESGYIVWGEKSGELVIQPYSDANPTTNYSTQWGASVRTKVTIYVYYRTRTYTATTYLPQTYFPQVNSVYG